MAVSRKPRGCMVALLAMVALTVVSVGISAIYALSLLRTLHARPETAIRAALSGDGALFREQMTGPGSEKTGAELVEWSKSIKDRFGDLQRIDEASSVAAVAPPVGPKGDRMEIVFDLVFSKQTVPARFLLEPPPGTWMGLLKARIRTITLEPADQPAIVFP